MAKIFVSQPGFGGMLHQQTFNSMIYNFTKEHELSFKFVENASLIHHTRCNEFSRFYYGDFDYLLTVDNDMHIGPAFCLDDLINKLPPNSIGGAFYAKKALLQNGGGYSPINGVPINPKDAVFDGRLVECSRLATGFMLVPRSVAKQMIEAYPELTYEEEKIRHLFNHECHALYQTLLEVGKDGKRYFMGEDYSFCKRAQDIGIKMYADTSVQIAHIGNFAYCIDIMNPTFEGVRK